jgi:hypothetical protein
MASRHIHRLARATAARRPGTDQSAGLLLPPQRRFALWVKDAAHGVRAPYPLLGLTEQVVVTHLTHLLPSWTGMVHVIDQDSHIEVYRGSLDPAATKRAGVVVLDMPVTPENWPTRETEQPQ